MLLGPPVGIDAADRQSYFAWGFFAFIFCVGQALYALISENRELKAAQEPTFDRLFLPGDPRDGAQYLSERDWVQGPQSLGDVATPVRMRKYRIGIKSHSSVVVSDVELILARCVPCSAHNNVLVWGHLVVTDSDPPVARSHLHPTQSDTATLFFDVVMEFGPQSRTPERFGFCYANQNISKIAEYDLMNGDEYQFTILLRAQGGGYSCEREFFVKKEPRTDEYGRRWMPVTMQPQ